MRGHCIVSMVCDGAKPSCAAKIAMAVEAGFLGYEMYQNGKNQFLDGEGIVKKGVDNTIRTVGRMEQELKKSGVDYIIYRPTGYFYDIVKVFRPMVEKGKVTLLGGKPVSANVIDTPDFADYIVRHLDDKNLTVSIGGRETYTYEQIARMLNAASGPSEQMCRSGFRISTSPSALMSPAVTSHSPAASI